MKVEDCYGRLFTKDQVDQEVIEQAQLLPSMIEEKGKLFSLIGYRLGNNNCQSAVSNVLGQSGFHK